MIHESKKPEEIIPITIDFSPSLPEGETLSSSSVSAIEASGAGANGLVLDNGLISGDYVTTTVGAYVRGTYFLLVTVITTPGGYKLREDVKLTISEELGGIV